MTHDGTVINMDATSQRTVQFTLGRVVTIVPQLSKCLKFEAIWEDLRLIKRFVFKQRDITRSACTVVQRMAHHTHLIHLNYPDLS